MDTIGVHDVKDFFDRVFPGDFAVFISVLHVRSWRIVSVTELLAVTESSDYLHQAA